jgi:hypothetical protein
MAVTSLVVLGAARWLVEPARSHAGLPGSTAPEPAPVLTAPVDLALAGRA